MATASLILRGRQQIRRAGRNDGNGGARVCNCIDATLHHPVTAPGEDELCPGFESLLDLLRREAALCHLPPLRIGDAALLERLPKLKESAVKRLA